MSEKVKKPLWKRWWFWVIAIIIIGAVANPGGEEPTATAPQSSSQSGQATAQPTQEPENEPTMTKAEFDAIQNGMTYEEVVSIVGGEGELMSETGSPGDPLHTVMYMWQGEGDIGANANAMFQGGKMVNKAQLGLK